MPLDGENKTAEISRPAMSEINGRDKARSTGAVLNDSKAASLALSTWKQVGIKVEDHNPDTSRHINFNPTPIVALTSIP